MARYTLTARDQEGLTVRAKQYADLIRSGASYDEIATQLNVTRKTVEWMCCRVRAMLNLPTPHRKTKKYSDRRDEFGLTETYRRYADLVIHGMTYRKIADELQVPINRVNNYASRIREHFRVQTDVQVCRIMLLQEPFVNRRAA